MQPRKWVIFFAVSIFLATFILYQGFRYLAKHRNLENALIQGISPVINGKLDIGKLRIGFFSVHLENVNVSLPKNSFALTIRDIKIGFSFRKLLLYRGDISRSISKVILSGPVVDIFLFNEFQSPDTSHLALVPLQTLSVPVPRESPVQGIIIKKGVFRFVNRSGERIVVGEQLNGTLVEKAGAQTELNLNGKFSSSKNNFSLFGTISWTRGENKLNLSVNGARIKKPFVFKGGVVSSGVLNGSLLFAFPDTLTLSNLKSDGWLTIDGGTGTLDCGETIESLQLLMTMHEFNWNIDSLRCRYRGADAEMKGVFIPGSGEINAEFACTKINPGSFREFLPDTIETMLSGTGWVNGNFNVNVSGGPVAVKARAGGVQLGNVPSTEFRTAFVFENKKIDFDSLVVKNLYLSAKTQGFLKIVNPPQYMFTVSGMLDSFPGFDKFGGSVRLKGNVKGIGSDPQVKLQINGDSIRWENRFLGEVEMLLQGQKEHFEITNVRYNAFTPTITGSFDSLFTGSPSAQISMKMNSESINELLKRKPDTFQPESLLLEFHARGWLDSFDIFTEIGLKTSGFRGTFDCVLSKSTGTQSSINWRLEGRECEWNNIPLPVFSKGKMFGDSIVIDTLIAVDGFKARGSLSFGAGMPFVDASFWYAFNIDSLMSLLPAMAGKIEKGTVNGSGRIAGLLASPQIKSELQLKDVSAGGVSGLQTHIVLKGDGYNKWSALPMVLRKGTLRIVSFDTTFYEDKTLRFFGRFDTVDIRSMLGASYFSDIDIDGKISGHINTSDTGFPLTFKCSMPFVTINRWSFDSLVVVGALRSEGIEIEKLTLKESHLVSLMCKGYLPWRFLGDDVGDRDTLRASMELGGDILAFLQKNIVSPIGGHGIGKAKFAFWGVPGDWHFSEGTVSIPEGVLTVKPFVLDDIKDFSFKMSVDSAATVTTDIRGTIRRRPVRIFSNHQIPAGYDPFIIGPLDFGMLQVETLKRGIHIHLPGFMPVGELGDIEFAGKTPFSKFTLSGPIDKLKITGAWILRDLEFTFPFLNTNEISWDFDLFPFVTWELDLRPGNRKVMYFWDLAGKKRRILRFLEGYLDLASQVSVRGRDMDKTFSLNGIIRSFKGSAYYGKVFDRNFDIGVEFVPQKLDNGRGYDNLPVLWGSAEAFADTSRAERIKLTCLVNDPLTRSLSERGRLVEGKNLNVTFHLSSDIEEVQGEAERDFYLGAGLTFTTIGKAGKFVSSFGEQLFHRYLLQRWERKLAKSIGLDVINIESSIASNYFSKLSSRQFDGFVNQNDYLALANVGITVGRYFFRDFLFLKARGELIPIDTMLTPEYSIGMEFQASRYLTMDFNYGIHKREFDIEHNPRFAMQLRLPLARLRNFLKF